VSWGPRRGAARRGARGASGVSGVSGGNFGRGPAACCARPVRLRPARAPSDKARLAGLGLAPALLLRAIWASPWKEPALPQKRAATLPEAGPNPTPEAVPAGGMLGLLLGGASTTGPRAGLHTEWRAAARSGAATQRGGGAAGRPWRAVAPAGGSAGWRAGRGRGAGAAGRARADKQTQRV
jgi:hypothetical protein